LGLGRRGLPTPELDLTGISVTMENGVFVTASPRGLSVAICILVDLFTCILERDDSTDVTTDGMLVPFNGILLFLILPLFPKSPDNGCW
jgi:hypothetical protein